MPPVELWQVHKTSSLGFEWRQKALLSTFRQPYPTLIAVNFPNPALHRAAVGAASRVSTVPQATNRSAWVPITPRHLLAGIWTRLIGFSVVTIGVCVILGVEGQRHSPRQSWRVARPNLKLQLQLAATRASRQSQPRRRGSPCPGPLLSLGC
jgi:hypothetical protein